MSRRITLAVVLVAFVSIVAFAVPLAIGVGRLYRDEAVLRLQREGQRAVAAVPESFQATNDPIELPVPPDGIRTAVYGLDGRRVVGTGPERGGPLVASAERGRVTDGRDRGDLAVATPVFDEEEVVAVVRSAQHAGAADRDANQARLLMAGLAALVVAGASVIGLLVSRRLARPVEDLAAAATRLGSGNFVTRAPRSGVREIDAAAAALDRTGGRLGDALERERRFSADASHQLRTPLTRLRLALESIDVDDATSTEDLVAEALGHADRLEATIDELLALARDVQPDHASTELAPLLAELDEHWHERFAVRGRRFDVQVDPGLTRVGLSPVALRHTLDVLVTNALDHGAGRVTVTATRAAAGGVTLDVTDEGPGLADPEAAFARRGPDATGHGIGLALARSLVEAEGGRLVVAHAAPIPTLKILAPEVPDAPEATDA